MGCTLLEKTLTCEQQETCKNAHSGTTCNTHKVETIVSQHENGQLTDILNGIIKYQK